MFQTGIFIHIPFSVHLHTATGTSIFILGNENICIDDAITFWVGSYIKLTIADEYKRIDFKCIHIARNWRKKNVPT